MRMLSQRKGTSILEVLAIAAFVLAGLARPSAADSSLDRLRNSIEDAIPAAQGVIGVSIKHLETGAGLSIRGDESFPMASTFKLPLLVELYAMAKAGRLRWEERVELSPTDQHLGSSALTALYDPPA